MKYKIYSNGVIDTTNGSIIPNSNANADWAEYQLWLLAGNIPDPEFTVTEVEVQRVTEIKEKANELIINAMPEWKQRNNIARIVELVSKAVDLSTLSTGEQTEITTALTEWASIKAVRTASDTAEVNGDAPADIVWPT